MNTQLSGNQTPSLLINHQFLRKLSNFSTFTWEPSVGDFLIYFLVYIVVRLVTTENKKEKKDKRNRSRVKIGRLDIKQLKHLR